MQRSVSNHTDSRRGNPLNTGLSTPPSAFRDDSGDQFSLRDGHICNWRANTFQTHDISLAPPTSILSALVRIIRSQFGPGVYEYLYLVNVNQAVEAGTVWRRTLKCAGRRRLEYAQSIRSVAAAMA